MTAVLETDIALEKTALERYVPPAKPSLVGLTRAVLAEALGAVGVPPSQRKMRVQQLWHWIYVRGAQDFSQMTSVSKELHAVLDTHYTLARPEVVAEQISVDGTRKWLLRLPGEHEGERPHEVELRKKVKTYLAGHDTEGLHIQIMPQVWAMRYTLERATRGQDTIAVTGNILRDYLTDLFPILELGTSAKMLSIVPLMAGGGMYETGAGGSAPKHVQQLVEENHLRWDSLGEFLALGACFEDLGDKTSNKRAALLGKTLDGAIGKLLENNKGPSRKTGEIDNRGSQFYLALYWAQELAEQTDDQELADHFAKLAKSLAEKEDAVISELAEGQGTSVDIGGYYYPDPEKTTAVMRPSKTLNDTLAAAQR